MSLFGPPIPKLDESLLRYWLYEEASLDQFNKTITLVNKFLGLSDNVLHYLETDIDFDPNLRKNSGLIKGLGLFSFKADLLESHSHDLLEKDLVAKTVEYIRRHSIIFALTELHVTKFHFLSHSLICSVNSNNILAATSTLRDIFEVVGTYAHFHQSAQKKGSQNSLIENAKDILTSKSATPNESKHAINRALSDHTEHDSRMGNDIIL